VTGRDETIPPDVLAARRLAAMEAQLARSDRHLAYFHGRTMLPLLQEGDHVHTEPVSWRDVRIGDVVTYRFEDKFPTRRIVAIDRERRTFIIMGDSIPGRREYHVPFDDVIARVVRRRREGVWLTTSSIRWRLRTAQVLANDYLRRARWLGGARRAWRLLRRRFA
jgi:hypothetical protein